MNDRRFVTTFLALALLAAVCGTAAAPSVAAQAPSALPSPLGTAFTYQGSLVQGDVPVSRAHAFRFILYDSEAGGSQVGETLTLPDVAVDNGVFTVPLDFGAAVFDGRALWLEVAVRPAGGTGAFTTLSPRQAITASPYTLYTGAWNLHGNAGTNAEEFFLGTTDDQPLVLRTNGNEAMRITGDGSVGLGTTVPEAKVDIVAGANGIALRATGYQQGLSGRLGDTQCNGSFAVAGCAGDTGEIGVFGWSNRGIGVVGASRTASAVKGYSDSGAGVQGGSNSSFAIQGDSQSGIGVHGESNTNRGVEGLSQSGIGVLGDSRFSRGVVGTLGQASCPGAPYAVGGCAGTSGGVGVLGNSDTGIGILGDSSTRGIVGTLGHAGCDGQYAVGGCAGNAVAAGVFAQGNTVAVFARSDAGDVFVGVTGAAETHVARIDHNGRGYFNGGTQTGGADYAESIRTTDDPAALEPGDVLALDPQSGYAVRRSREANSRLVAGVYSTRPSILAVGEHGIDDPRPGEVPMALLGVVPTKVTAANGPIQIGDLLVSSALPGRAMKALPDIVNGVLVYPTGAILGKALEPLAQGIGVIKVLVTLR